MTDLGYKLLTEEEKKELERAREIASLQQDINMVQSLCERSANSPLLETRMALLSKLENDMRILRSDK